MTVFEATNDTLREVYIGTTERLMERLVDEFERRPPARTAHWDKAHRIGFRCVEYAIPASDARAFIDNYASSEALSGWKILRD